MNAGTPLRNAGIGFPQGPHKAANPDDHPRGEQNPVERFRLQLVGGKGRVGNKRGHDEESPCRQRNPLPAVELQRTPLPLTHEYDNACADETGGDSHRRENWTEPGEWYQKIVSISPFSSRKSKPPVVPGSDRARSPLPCSSSSHSLRFTCDVVPLGFKKVIVYFLLSLKKKPS
jgi:hypothetical protein